MSAILDPIQFSFERQERLEHLCKFFLEQEDIVLPLKKRLRLQFMVALGEIGEPPLPTPQELRQEAETREMMHACERSDANSGWWVAYP